MGHLLPQCRKPSLYKNGNHLTAQLLSGGGDRERIVSAAPACLSLLSVWALIVSIAHSRPMTLVKLAISLSKQSLLPLAFWRNPCAELPPDVGQRSAERVGHGFRAHAGVAHAGKPAEVLRRP